MKYNKTVADLIEKAEKTAEVSGNGRGVARLNREGVEVYRVEIDHAHTSDTTFTLYHYNIVIACVTFIGFNAIKVSNLYVSSYSDAQALNTFLNDMAVGISGKPYYKASYKPSKCYGYVLQNDTLIYESED